MFNKYILVFFVNCLLNQSLAFLRLENITVTHGEHVQFRCQFPRNYSPKDNIIQWKKLRSKDDNLIISINGRIPKTYENIYQTTLTNQFSSLDLSNVNREDSTTYICQTFETQTILCQYNLIVLIKPEAPSLTINDDNIQEYQTVTLTCSSSNGNPPPQYTWYRNGTLLTSLNEQVLSTDNSSTYTFNITRFDNNIKYECQISSQALRKPIRLEKYLYVKYRPLINIVSESPTSSINEKIIAFENTEQKLTCQIDANPPATSIYWTINGTQIVNRERTVHLPRLTPEQNGIYTCIAENSIGKSNRSITLDVQYAPRVSPAQPLVVVNRSDTAILRCHVQSNPLPYEIVWLKNNYEIFRQNQLSDLRIGHVERNDSGLYTCMIYNRLQNNLVQNGSSTIELRVQSRPILETTYSKIAAEIGQTLTLNCRVTGEPKANIFWKRNEQIHQCSEMIDDQCLLKISQITNQDFGSYRCIAENLLGKEEWTYTVVSRGRPETPHDIRVQDITASSFKVQFSPSFDGGAGPQRFLIEVNFNDRNTSLNSTILHQQIPFNTYEYLVKDLNESTWYKFRIKSTNIYGESPWSSEIPVQTSESILTFDDLPQLHLISYNSKENYLHFDYLPSTNRLFKLTNDQLCLNVRQSADGKFYQTIPECLTIENNRVHWIIKKDFPFLKLSICSKKQANICGQEIEMKDDSNQRSSAPMIIGIVVTSCFLLLSLLIILGIFCCRWRKNRLTDAKTNKFGITGLEKGVRPIISEPRLQNPYLLYTNTNSHSSPYHFSSTEYQQRKIPGSFAHPCDIIDQEPSKDELSVHDACSSYLDGPGIRNAAIHTASHWILPNTAGGSTRSNSNPSSEFSCLTQNTNILVAANDMHSNSTPPIVSHYGFPSMISTSSKTHPLVNMTSTQRSSSFDQPQTSSGNSTPNRMKKLFYEVVV